MVENDCRLCFEKKSTLIAIFTSNGIELEIAEIIRKHLPDEVRESDDILPKFVCLYCWTKLQNFHEFYNAVDEAKNIYLRNAVKEELPNFIQINCDGFDEGIVSVKNESASVEVINFEASPTGFHGSQNQDEFDDLIDVKDDTENIKFGEETSLIDGVFVKATTETALAENASDFPKMEALNEDQLVVQQLHIKCGICNRLLRTASETINHYRSQHNANAYHKQIIKCCDRQLLPYDIRDHVQYHFNPDAFKCDKCDKRFLIGRHLKSHEQVHFPKDFECDICKSKFINRQNVRYHILRMHTTVKPQHECKICKKRMATKNRLAAHQQKHVLKQCNICKKTFAKPSILKEHIIRSHTSRPHECELCRKCFATEKVLREHIRYHANPEAFKCDKCNKCFTHHYSLKAHQQTHFPKDFECDICKSQFISRQYVRHHILSMHATVKYECEICKKRMATKSRLATHQQTHVLKQCVVCKKTFAKPSILKAHIIRSHNTRPYECEFCKKCFATEKIRHLHVQKVHERKFHRVCHICAKVYSTNAAFKRHLQEHSGVEQPRVNCHVCGNSYKNDIVLKTHMILHEDEGKKFPCPHCSKMPPNRLALKSHIYEMHKFKLRKCNFCEKGCKTNQELREHVATHTGEYLYNCEYCTKKFKSHSSRSQHYKRCHPAEWKTHKSTNSRTNKKING